MNVMNYSALIKCHPSLMNLTEHDVYFPHNMHMMISGTMDLIASPHFDIRELGNLREALWCAQQMGRIGNLVTTWEREVTEGDFSSDVFALGLRWGVLSVENLENEDSETISRRIREADLESEFLRRWQEMHDRICQLASACASVDINSLVRGLETLIQLHIGSRGLK